MQRTSWLSTFRRHVFFAGMAFSLSGGFFCVSAQDGSGLDPFVERRLAELKFENELIVVATDLAAKGSIDEAWTLLMGDVPSPGRIAYRAAAVSGFLRNRSEYVIADQFARLALAQFWADATRLPPGKERGDVSYWSARIVADVLKEPVLALERANDAERSDPQSARNRELRQRLDERVRTSRRP